MSTVRISFVYFLYAKITTRPDKLFSKSLCMSFLESFENDGLIVFRVLKKKLAFFGGVSFCPQNRVRAG